MYTDIKKPKHTIEYMAVELLIASINDLLGLLWVNPPEVEYFIPVRPTFRNRFTRRQRLEGYYICKDSEGSTVFLTIDSEVTAFIGHYRRTGHLWWSKIGYSRQLETFALDDKKVPCAAIPVLYDVYYALKAMRD